MGGDDQKQAPELQATPPPPTADQVADNNIKAQQKYFDASLPLMDQFGQFQLNQENKYLPQTNQLNLQQGQIFGPQLVSLAMDLAKQADPTGFALRQSLVDSAQKGVNAGGGFTPDEYNQLTNDFRQSQANRGFGTGLSDSLDEAGFITAQRFAREQARNQNALAVLSGQNPGNAFMGLTNGVQQAGVPNSTSIFGNYNPSTGQVGADQQQAYQNQVAQTDYLNNLAINRYNLTPQPKNQLKSGLSGAFAGASAGSALGPYGAAGGALAGGLMGAFG